VSALKGLAKKVVHAVPPPPASSGRWMRPETKPALARTSRSLRGAAVRFARAFQRRTVLLASIPSSRSSPPPT
jgi:hypothetical protein